MAAEALKAILSTAPKCPIGYWTQSDSDRWFASYAAWRVKVEVALALCESPGQLWQCDSCGNVQTGGDCLRCGPLTSFTGYVAALCESPAAAVPSKSKGLLATEEKHSRACRDQDISRAVQVAEANQAEAVATFVEHLRDDFVSTTEPVKKVARLIRERFAYGRESPAAETPRERGTCNACKELGVQISTRLGMKRCAQCGSVNVENVRAVPTPAAETWQPPTAEQIARLAHDGQFDKFTPQTPYIQHVERVVALVDGADAKQVAWLHDVVEDTRWTVGALQLAGVSQRIIDAVAILTRQQQSGQTTYAEYIAAVKTSNNPLALAVKIADLKDHLRPEGIELMRPSMRMRYEAALVELMPLPAPPTSVAAQETNS